MSTRTKEGLWGYFFILPWIIGFLLFSAGPIVATIYLAFTKYNVIQKPTWIGLRNFTNLFTNDDNYLQSVLVTVQYTLYRVPAIIIIGLLLAILINRPGLLTKICRVIFYLPSILPLVAASVLWLWLLSPQQGFIGPFFRDNFAVALPNWLHDETWALPAIVALSAWQMGQTMMIFLAGLQEIPGDLMEAAEIDGAGPVRRFFSITIPMLTPTIYFNVIVGIIASFQVFAAVFIMTKGGPVNATMVYVMYLYQRGIQFLEMGYASAMALVLVAIVLALTFVIMKTSDRWVTYDRI
jgi:multiple sugar transport system permease protein